MIRQRAGKGGAVDQKPPGREGGADQDRIIAGFRHVDSNNAGGDIGKNVTAVIRRNLLKIPTATNRHQNSGQRSACSGIADRAANDCRLGCRGQENIAGVVDLSTTLDGRRSMTKSCCYSFFGRGQLASLPQILWL